MRLRETAARIYIFMRDWKDDVICRVHATFIMPLRRRLADSVVECIVRALEEQGRRRKSVKSLWVRPVAVGVMLVLLAYWVRGVDADLSEAAAMNERIDTLAQEKAILSEEIAEAKNTARALRHEVDLLAKKHRDETVPKTHVSVAALRREIEQLRESIQHYKNDVEALKQKLKHKHDEAASQSENEAVRQELIDLLKGKQSKKYFLVEKTWIKKEIDDSKENEATLNQEINGLLEKQQVCMAEPGCAIETRSRIIEADTRYTYL